MKTFATVSAAALIALTGAASAMTGAAEGAIHQYLPGYDVSVVSADALNDAAEFVTEANQEGDSFAAIQNGLRVILAR